jgi:undecaprenyl diphosphate synthase
MFSIQNLDRLLARETPRVDSLPRHIAIDGNDEYAGRAQQVLQGLLQAQVRLNIPIMTVSIGQDIDSLLPLLTWLGESQVLHRYQVKLSFLGKWYDASGRIVEGIRSLIGMTKDYDRFFFNICINYDGQEEIVDSCKIIARKIRAGKIDVDVISKELIKENLYSSYFLPPDIIMMTGKARRVSRLLLWDSPGAFYCFPKKRLSELTESDLLRAVLDFSP